MLKSYRTLQNSTKLYPVIMGGSFTRSRAEKTSDITKALRKVIWGVSWLEKLDKSVTSTLPIVEEAMEHVDSRLSKVGIH